MISNLWKIDWVVSDDVIKYSTSNVMINGLQFFYGGIILKTCLPIPAHIFKVYFCRLQRLIWFDIMLVRHTFV